MNSFTGYITLYFVVLFFQKGEYIEKAIPPIHSDLYYSFIDFEDAWARWPLILHWI